MLNRTVSRHFRIRSRRKNIFEKVMLNRVWMTCLSGVLAQRRRQSNEDWQGLMKGLEP